ncbi:hypothetical protein CMO89_00540 [Candidatus Woesearchaeota archaeon]|nr:hypothetical protein [Candidatus Woesearchaeota archaeon]|tara:strand:- start:20777 stop:21310 length:534 start_codon:yes stop_codon:yes gene_type:complete
MVRDYELLPGKDIARIKKELGELKGSGLSAEKIETLNRNLGELIDIIKVASDQMKLEETDPYSHKLDQVIEKLDKLIYENKEIAEGIIAVADLVKKPKETPHHKPPMGTQPHPMPPPLNQPPSPQNQPPGPMPPLPAPLPPITPPPGPQQTGPVPIPPLQPIGKPEKKPKKLFGLFK